MSVSFTFLQGYQWFAGLADSATGVCLLIAPILTMSLLGIDLREDAAPYLSYMGVFVLGIGLSYFLCGKLERTEKLCACWEATWRFTATCRSLVALFLVCQISLGRFPVPWITVAISDATLAGFQWIGLRQGWLGKEATS